VVTHLTTNPPVRCLNRAERTGSLVFNVLWSYVVECRKKIKYNPKYLHVYLILLFLNRTSSTLRISCCRSLKVRSQRRFEVLSKPNVFGPQQLWPQVLRPLDHCQNTNKESHRSLLSLLCGVRISSGCRIKFDSELPRSLRRCTVVQGCAY
jgi:hypothetical protein